MSKIGLQTKKRLILYSQISFFVLIYFIIFIIFRNKIPDFSKMIDVAGSIYETYGYILIFLGALIEGTFIVGFYIPGSFIVFLGVSLARMGITSFPLVIFLGTAGFCIGYSINYILGRFGWYKIIEWIGFEKQIVETKDKLKHHFNTALFWGYMMPSTGSILSTVSGIMKIPFKGFVIKTVLIQTFWSLVLGGLAYLFGMTFIHLFLVYFGTIALIGMGVYLFNKTHEKKS